MTHHTTNIDSFLNSTPCSILFLIQPLVSLPNSPFRLSYSHTLSAFPVSFPFIVITDLSNQISLTAGVGVLLPADGVAWSRRAGGHLVYRVTDGKVVKIPRQLSQALYKTERGEVKRRRVWADCVMSKSSRLYTTKLSVSGQTRCSCGSINLFRIVYK